MSKVKWRELHITVLYKYSENELEFSKEVTLERENPDVQKDMTIIVKAT